MDATLTPSFGPSPTRRPMASAAVLATHVLAFWALLQFDTLHHALQRGVQEVAPLMVSLVDTPRPAPAPSLPTPPAPQQPAPVAALAVPEVEIRRETVDVAPAVPAVAAEVPAAAVTPALAVGPATPAPTLAPPQPPAPQRVAASALRYLVEPAVVVPKLSRRARESGTVLLHVVVDRQGLPRQVSLRQSSGFARLDEQAQTAMRAARFVPCTDNGAPVECEADAPIVYELDN